MPKLYLLFFLCNKRDQLEQEQAVDHELEKVGEFTHQLEEITICMTIVTIGLYIDLNQRRKMYLGQEIPFDDKFIKSVSMQIIQHMN